MRARVVPVLERALEDLGAATRECGVPVHPVEAEVRALIAAVQHLEVALDDGGPVPATLIERLARQAGDHCENARALASQSELLVARSRRLAEDARSARDAGAERRATDGG